MQAFLTKEYRNYEDQIWSIMDMSEADQNRIKSLMQERVLKGWAKRAGRGKGMKLH